MISLTAISVFVVAIGEISFGLGSWLLIAASFQGISYFFGGEGSFSRTLAFVGWGFLPLIAGALVLIVANTIVLLTTPPIAVPQSAGQAAVVFEQLPRNPASFVANTFSTVLIAWSAYIWVKGLEHARGLSTRRGVFTVVIPALVFGVLNLLL